MPTCCILLCKNYIGKTHKCPGISFHRFPADFVMHDKWVKIIRKCRAEYWWKPAKNTKICSIHFDEEAKYKSKCGLRRLRQDAVPTKHLYIRTLCDSDLNQSNQEPSMMNVSEEISGPEPEQLVSIHLEEFKSTGSESHDNVLNSSDTDFVFDSPQEATLRRKLEIKTKLQIKHQKQIKQLKQQIRTLSNKKSSLIQILKTLKKERYINNNIHKMLSENVFASQLYSNLNIKLSKNKKRPMPKYTAEFRRFCLTLHFYSPRAYNYVRSKFNYCLPHAKTLSNWYKTINGSPGFTSEALNLLKLKGEHSENKT